VLAVLRQGRYLRLLAVALVAAALCGAAGRWQYERWHGKRDANAELRANAAAAPVPVETLLAPGRAFDPALRMRPVRASGRYDPAGEVYVRQRQVENEAAFLVVTPLRTTAGPVLLVVRGWVPAGGSALETPRVPAPPDGEVSVLGRAYPSEPGGSSTRLPDRQVNRIDAAAIGQRLGAETFQGYAELVDQQPPNAGPASAGSPGAGSPGAGKTSLSVLPTPDLSNPAGGADEWQHLAYVVQWYLFAVIALLAPFLLAYLERRPAVTSAMTVGEPSRPWP